MTESSKDGRSNQWIEVELMLSDKSGTYATASPREETVPLINFDTIGSGLCQGSSVGFPSLLFILVRLNRTQI